MEWRFAGALVTRDNLQTKEEVERLRKLAVEQIEAILSKIDTEKTVNDYAELIKKLAQLQYYQNVLIHNRYDWPERYFESAKLLKDKVPNVSAVRISLLPVIEEFGELLNSVNYQHWRNASNQFTPIATYRDLLFSADETQQNILMELIDVLHFLLTTLFIAYWRIDLVQSNNIDKFIVAAAEHFANKSDEFLKVLLNRFNLFRLLQLYSKVIDTAFNNQMELNSIKTMIFIGELRELVFNIVSPDPLVVYNVYTGKLTLNIFRQYNGYAEGTYKKLWCNNKEDNVYLMEKIKQLVAENKPVEYRELFNYLQSKYNEYL